MAEKQEACEPMTGGSEDPENPPEYTSKSIVYVSKVTT